MSGCKCFYQWMTKHYMSLRGGNSLLVKDETVENGCLQCPEYFPPPLDSFSNETVGHRKLISHVNAIHVPVVDVNNLWLAIMCGGLSEQQWSRWTA